MSLFVVLHGCAIPPAIAHGENHPVRGTQELTAPNEAWPEELATTTTSQKPQEELLSPEGKRNIGLCLLAGPLFAGWALFLGMYIATFGTLCTPVAAIAAPMGTNSFQDELKDCIRRMN